MQEEMREVQKEQGWCREGEAAAGGGAGTGGGLVQWWWWLGGEAILSLTLGSTRKVGTSFPLLGQPLLRHRSMTCLSVLLFQYLFTFL